MLSTSFYQGLKVACFTAALFTSFQASADIVISGTRIVYPQSQKDVVVSLDNRGKKPLLVQAWLDDGRDETNPQELKLPFIITPPVSRIDPQKGQSVRIAYLGGQLPQDRESLFWFNVLEIPPKSKPKEGESPNQLLLAFRTRIKLFFRPEGLKGTPGEAAAKVTWSQQKQDSGWSLVARNDSPYNVSVANVTLKSAGKTYQVDHKSILPFSTQTMQVKGLSNHAAGSVVYETINDNGGSDSFEANVN